MLQMKPSLGQFLDSANTGGPRLSGPQLPRFRNTGIEKKVPSPRLLGIPRNSGTPISNRYPGILRNS